MKRVIAVILALILTLSLAACGGGGKAQEPGSATAGAAAQKEKISKEAIAKALNEAESAADLQKLIDAMEGAYGEDEVIDFDGDTVTLSQIREMKELFATIETIGEEPAPSGVPATGDALSAVGEWSGVYCKFVGDTDGITDEPFSLTLNADGTGTHKRDDLEIPVTWTFTDGDFAMTERYMGMTIDYTGTLESGVLHLYNDDPKDDLTYEYVYGQGDVSGIAVPHAEPVQGSASSGGSVPGGAEDAAGLEAFRGDWNGALGFRQCTGKYEYLDNSNCGAIARFAVQSDGSIQGFIGVDVEDTPIEDLTVTYSDFWEKLMLSGKWINAAFENVPAEVEHGTLSFVIPIKKDTGSLYMVFNLRRLGDPGWTDEDPQLGQKNYEYTKDMTFGELASLLGYDFMDYPSPDEG